MNNPIRRRSSFFLKYLVSERKQYFYVTLFLVIKSKS